MNLNGKKILMFAPDFFGYYKKITNNLEARGAKVYTILENYANASWLYRILLYKNDSTKYAYTERKLLKKINGINSEIDFVFVVRGEAISPYIMYILKDKYRKAKFLMYQWDSVHNNGNALKIYKYFDQVYTFDKNDAEQMSWVYRPLFFSEEGQLEYSKRKYDLSLVGTLYYKRAHIYKTIKQISKAKGWSFFGYLYSLRYVFLLHKYILRDKRYSEVTMSDVHFKSLNSSDVSNIYKQSKVVVDYAANDQAGLTMRTIESFGHRCKIITNNKYILREPMFDSHNVMLYENEDIKIDEKFINSPFLEPNSRLFYYYSLSGWVDTIFEV